nr:PAS domain-containing hybrid sensor histidine kinase/response regulator [Chitinivorax sp. B]
MLSITDIEASLQDVFYWDAVSAGCIQPVYHAEGQFRCADGRLIDVDKRIAPAQGIQNVLLISARDTSARQHIDQELEKSTSMLRATLEATADGILVTDITGRIVNINHRFADMWQLDDDLLARQDDGEILEAMTAQVCDPDSYLARLVDITEDPHGESGDLIEFIDGRVFERHSMPQAIRDHVVGRVFSFADITHRVRAESALREARDEAEQANRSKAEFLSQMSHELRTPLNAIIGFSQILADEVNADQQTTLQYITKAGWHLLDLINEILDFAKLEAGKLSISPETVNLHELIDDCLTLIQPIANQYGVSTLSSLPSPRSPALVRADRTRLKQMVLNLLSNGCKYNRPHGKVLVEIQASEKQTRISVRDTGIGISETDQTRLFQAFTRVGNRQSKIEGTGIGLAFTRRLAQLMEGDVGMHSQEGSGSTFWIDLPTASTAIPAPSMVVPERASSHLRQQYCVLCIEDDPANLLLLKGILGKYRPELHLVTAQTGSEGHAQALEHQPHLLISDMNLPDMTGKDALTIIRSTDRFSNLPAIALSANALPEDIHAGLAAGFNLYLTKPINFTDLIAAVDAMLTIAGNSTE